MGWFFEGIKGALKGLTEGWEGGPQRIFRGNYIGGVCGVTISFAQNLFLPFSMKKKTTFSLFTTSAIYHLEDSAGISHI